MARPACDYAKMPSNAHNGTKTVAKKASARGGHNSFIKGGSKARGKRGHRKHAGK